MGLYDYVMSNPYGSTSNNFFYKNSQTGEDFSILVSDISKDSILNL